MTVVGQASNAAAALELIPQTKPDVAVLDVRLGEGPDEPNGIEVCRDIRSQHPEVACVMLTSFADDEALLASIMAGASGYALKQISGAESGEGHPSGGSGGEPPGPGGDGSCPGTAAEAAT